MPRVTVLMSVYNGERFLRESVESILAQTFCDWELLIINDGSTDRSREIILSYHDPRIRLVDNERNLGLTNSLNRGLALATGQLIARQDADDISEPERLAKQVAFLDAHPEVVLLGTQFYRIDAQGQVLGRSHLPCDHIDLLWSLLFFCPFLHTSVMFAKSVVLETVGPYDPAYNGVEDYELWNRIARQWPVANLGEYLVRYRVHPQSITQSSDHSNRKGAALSMALIADLLGDDMDPTAQAERFRRMRHLLTWTSINLTVDELKLAWRDLRQLHEAFYQRYHLYEPVGQTHRRKLFHSVSQQLTVSGLRCLDQEEDAARAAHYWALAPQVDVRVLWSQHYAWLSLKLLLGTRLVKAAKHLLERAL